MVTSPPFLIQTSCEQKIAHLDRFIEHGGARANKISAFLGIDDDIVGVRKDVGRRLALRGVQLVKSPELLNPIGPPLDLLGEGGPPFGIGFLEVLQEDPCSVGVAFDGRVPQRAHDGFHHAQFAGSAILMDFEHTLPFAEQRGAQ